MKMADLISYGYPQNLVRIWQQEESEELLPVQARAIEEFKIFDRTEGGNLLVIAPTSAGKTFVGELAAVKEALEMRRSLFLVPFRAIAEEHYADFRKKYEEYGIRVVISDRDHREYDQDIIDGNYGIGVVVYEKLTGLLTSAPEVLDDCGLVVADEVQMVMDQERGPTIELLLTKLLVAKRRIRLVALSAVLDKLNQFDGWLKADVLVEKHRPVELREGIYLSDGRVQYTEFNSGNSGTEKLKAWTDRDEGLVNLVQTCVDRNEQLLVFCSSRPATVDKADMLAKQLVGMTPATSAIAQANDLTDSVAREEIQHFLRSAVAYHNSDLLLEESHLIVEAFRRREIKVIACTSTLAMGVNVPAENAVVLEPRKYTGQKWEPIGVGEYKNMVGRAGRYSISSSYGRSYLLAGSPATADSYDSTYIHGRLEEFASVFGERQIDTQVLDIIAGGYAKTSGETSEFVFSTYNGKYKWTSHEEKNAVEQRVYEAIERCLEYEAIEKDEHGNVNATKLGKLCASGGYLLDHLKRARDYLETYKRDVDASVIYWALDADFHCGQQAYHIPKLRTAEFRSLKYQRLLSGLLDNQNVGPVLERIGSNAAAIGYDDCVALRRCLACYAWISEMPTRKIESGFNVKIGAVRNTAAVCAWLISFLGEIVEISEPSSGRSNAMRVLSECLSYGCTKEALQLCRIRESGLSRDENNHLAKENILTVDDVLNRNPNEFPLSKRKVTGLIRAAESAIRDKLERIKRSQLNRLHSLGLDVSILDALYEKEGSGLEIAIDDLMEPPFVELTCQRVTRQRKGEPDHLLYDSSDRVLVIQTTARKKKNISMKKATAVIGQSAKYNPWGYIVIGRPDFESLAVKDAENQVSSGRNYKLIPVSVIGEMYVLFHEKLLSSDDIEEIFTAWKGYLSLDRILDRARAD